MSAELHDLVEEIRKTRESLEGGDTKTNHRIDGIEASLNNILKRLNRPGAEGGAANDNDTFELKSAVGLCRTRRALTVPKIDAGVDDNYEPTAAEIADARLMRKATRALWRHGQPDRLPLELRKSLTSFSLGSNDFILAPELATQALTCITDPTDLAGLVNTVNISAGSIRFFIDNLRINTAAWGCETTCFANNPQPDLQDGLGEMEIKAEPLRFIACAGSDLLADASFNVEMWLMRKVGDGFRNTISAAIIAGDGLSKPSGLLNPASGIPILDTAPSTPPDQMTWQDLVMLKWDLPVQWHNGGAYYMNQRTWALISTMSDAIGRPLFTPMPQGTVGFLLNGSPVTIVTQMPDVVAGNTPVMFANLKQAYTLAIRQAMVMRPDPYSAGFCTLFRFEARVGGAVTCGNAARLLRIR